jgi:DNA-binding transcriptional LysR family regulator
LLVFSYSFNELVDHGSEVVNFLSKALRAGPRGALLRANLQFNRILTSDFAVLPLIAARSDFIVLAPRSVARLFSSNLPLQIGPSPLPVPDLDLVMVFESRRQEEQELAWLRDPLKCCVKAVFAS